MPDVVRSRSALQVLLADNVAGDISAQDVRDFLVSSFGIHLIEEIELGADGTISFSSIPAHWRDLLIVGRLRVAAAANAGGVDMRVGNGAVDAGANYSYGLHQRSSNASGEQESSGTNQAITAIVVGNNAAAGRFSGYELRIMRYTDTGFPRAWVCNAGGFEVATAVVSNGGGEWSNSADVIDIVTLGGTALADLEAGSALALYGVGHV